MYMAIHIQDPETDRLARELSAFTGETITQAVNASLRQRLRVVLPAVAPQSEEEYVAALEAIVEELNSLPNVDTRSEDEILGYNEHGYFD